MSRLFLSRNIEGGDGAPGGCRRARGWRSWATSSARWVVTYDSQHAHIVHVLMRSASSGMTQRETETGGGGGSAPRYAASSTMCGRGRGAVGDGGACLSAGDWEDLRGGRRPGDGAGAAAGLHPGAVRQGRHTSSLN
eukprot:COSAG01_NODE_1694_length_9467_cov_4.976196_6_plen_137_part_00